MGIFDKIKGLFKKKEDKKEDSLLEKEIEEVRLLQEKINVLLDGDFIHNPRNSSNKTI